MTNLYPTPDRPYISPFVKEQVEAVLENYPDMTIDVYVIEGLRPRFAYIRAMLLLPAFVKKGGYDIVHAHFGLTLVSTLFVRVPVIITFHGSDLLINPTKHISKFLAPMTSKAIVVAQSLKKVLGFGEVIPCGIDVKKFKLPPPLEQKSIPGEPGKLKILFPGNPERKEKNYSLFRAVCEDIEKRGISVMEVHLVNVRREEVPKLFWDCDIMILTSTSEGSPTVIKEAIAAKIPFISVDVGDVKEWVDLVTFGVVVTGRDPKNIADTAITLLNQIENRALLCNKKCLEKIDINNTAKKIRRVYDQVLDTF